MKKIKFITLFIILSLSTTLAQANPTASPSQAADPSSTDPTGRQRFEGENTDSYQKLRESLIPKQEDFIQWSKNLDSDNNTKLTPEEKVQVKFTEGNLETQILPRLLKIIIYSSILIFTGIFIYAGIILIISNGDETSYTEVKNLILNTLIGVGVILGSYAIIYGIVTILQNLRT